MLVGTVYAASYTGDLLGVVLLPTASLDCFLQSWALFVAPHSLDMTSDKVPCLEHDGEGIQPCLTCHVSS